MQTTSLRAGRLRRVAAAFVAASLALALAAGVAAHEPREVGEFTLTVGFMEEPALVNEPNGLSLEILRGSEDSGTPVEGLGETLQAEVTFGSETRPLELRPVFNEPGHYTADVFPTAPGAYSFRIFGDIEGTAIDETFSAGPETFSEVVAISDISFPATGDGASGDASSASEAQDTADSARTLATVGLVAGIVGLTLGVAALMIVLRLRAASATVSRSTAEPGD